MKHTLKRTAAMLTGTALGFAGLTALSAPAGAEDIPDAITNVAIDAETLHTWDWFTVEVEWAVPDGSSGGDTFTLELPAELKPLDASFDLAAPDSSLVATAEIVDSEVTFTLTDYAETHTDVGGTATFESVFEPGSVVAGDTHVFHFENDSGDFWEFPTDIVPGVTDRANPQKYGYWHDAIAQGAEPERALGWVIESSMGPLRTVEFVDTIGAGHEIDCDTLKGTVLSDFDANGAAGSYRAAPAGYYSVANCSTSGFTVTAGPVAAGTVFRVTYDTTITDPAMAPFQNRATVTQDGLPREIQGGVRYSRASGDAYGSTIPEIDIEKWSTVDGAAAGDYDAAPGKPLTSRAPEEITFTIANPGNEPLVDVVVEDTTQAGDAINGLDCTFPDGSTGTEWAGPFGMGDSFECTGTLPGMDPNTQHSDTATVTAAGRDTATPVRDEDQWHGLTPDAPVPGVDIEKWSTVDGPVAGDYDETFKPLAIGADEDITFTITNPGPEPLVNVVVTDANEEGPGAEGFDCTFPDGSTGTQWPGPFAVGDSFDCTATLRGMDADVVHIDIANVEAEGEISGVPVYDEDQWRGSTPTPGVPGVDIEKWSTVDGATDGDYDEGPGKVLQTNSAEDISFTIANTGGEALLDVVVTDTTTDGPAVEDLDCTFPDGSTGTEWAGPFVVGATFECTATLPGMEAGLLHSDTATVTGVGEISGEPVEDEDEWHGGTTVLGILETFPPEETPAPPVATPDVPVPPVAVPDAPELPNTGSNALGLVGIAAAALLAGLVTVITVRRRANR